MIEQADPDDEGRVDASRPRWTKSDSLVAPAECRSDPTANRAVGQAASAKILR